jgi:hypothetical protein
MLTTMITSGSAPARTLTHARILLKATKLRVVPPGQTRPSVTLSMSVCPRSPCA